MGKGQLPVRKAPREGSASSVDPLLPRTARVGNGTVTESRFLSI